MRQTYIDQVKLLLRCLPHVAQETCFALKGGTALNLFLLDMPRLSVDIDLVYLPVAGRDESLNGIVEALLRIKRGAEAAIGQCTVDVMPSRDIPVARLVVRRGDAHIKIEPNTVIRGSVYEPVEMDLCIAAQDKFEMFVTNLVLSKADLYGGKICAALDRQHPRDLFDVKVMLDNEGLPADIRRAFVVYLASHNRTMHELLSPTPKDIRQAYASSFVGMMTSPPREEELLEARAKLVATLRSGLDDKEREFLLALKRREPKWDLIDIPHVATLPAVKWKIANLERMNAAKHRAAVAALEKVLNG